MPASADYIDARLPPYTPDRAFTVVNFSPEQAEREDRAEATVDAQPGEFVATNLKAFPQLVHISGAQPIARVGSGNAILEIAANAKPGAAHIVITTAHPWPVMVGKLLTLVGLLGLAGVGLTLLMRGRRAGVKSEEG
jgi:hypothetical protein